MYSKIVVGLLTGLCTVVFLGERHSSHAIPATTKSVDEIKDSNLETGKNLYRQKKYQEAKAFLEKAVAKNPESWQAHFYYAHTLMALGRVSNAKHHYKMSKHVTNHPAVHAHCDKALERVEVYYSSFKPKPSESKDGDKKKDDKPSLEDQRKEKIEAKKREIMQEAHERCAKVRSNAERQIQIEKQNSQEVYRYSNGTIGTDISDEREAAIRAQAHRECKRIMDTATNRARGYR